jgi:ABC-type transport system substrate-binding protein
VRRAVLGAATAAGAALVPLLLHAALGPRYGGELKVGVMELPATTEPGGERGGGAGLVSLLAHETLVGVDEGGFPSPALAQGWSTGAGGREWTLRLWEGASFHDGRPVTAADVVRSLRRFLRSPSFAAARLADGLDGGGAFRARQAEELGGLVAPDGRHVVLRFIQAQAMPLAALAAPAAAVTSPSGAGAGPFVPAAPVPGRRLAFTAFTGHVRGRPYLDRVEVVALPDSSSAPSETASAPIDVAPGEPGVTRLAATLLLILDPSRPPFDRTEARAAVAAAIDRGDLVRHLLPGGDAAASLLAPGLLPPLGLGASPPAGRVTGTATLAVSREIPALVSQRVVAHLTTLGLRVAVVPSSPATVLAAPTHARLTMWAPEVAEAGLALRELAAIAPVSPAAREELAAASEETDVARRRARLHRAEAALRADWVLLPLASVPVSYRTRPGVHGAAVDLAARLVLENAWVEP